MKDIQEPLQQNVSSCFESEIISLKLAQIYPLRVLDKSLLMGTKFARILSSIEEVGLVEPLVVSREGRSTNRYMLLDGHLRLEALQSLKKKEVDCLVSTDDEFYSYNKYVNRILLMEM